ncbi:MAG: glutamate--tRNA ligase [Candidatus Portnoybacteria bacterium]|nr:glutamate--tRNA ligase [Candidatus Portnoybacteria bacterium]
MSNSNLLKKNSANIRKSQVRTRIAPSPTGALHIGTARTALFNFLFARRNKGKFYLRIEDTDTERSRPEFEKDIVDNLKWLGLKWDGKVVKQSSRRKIYAKYIKKLLDSNRAFWCYHTKEELEKEKKEQQKRGEAQVHFCSHKSEPDLQFPIPSPKTDSLPAGWRAPRVDNFRTKGVIRLPRKKEKIIFDDLIRGKIEFDPNQIGDIVIAKDEESPLYNLAVVVDDYETNISHVIRGEDHISNTPKQIMILEALGMRKPRYAHIPLTLAPDKTKLSKRHGATAIAEYKELGYQPEALNNFMAFLGWNPGNDKELFSLEELIKEFSLERMQKSAAVFNIEKLDWYNSHYIKQMPLKELTKKCIPYLLHSSLRANEESEAISRKSVGLFRRLPPPRNDEFEITATGKIVDIKWLEKVVRLEQERMKKLSEIGELTKFFFQDKLEYEPELLRWKNMNNQELNNNLDKLYNLLSNIESKNFASDKLMAILMPEAEKMGDRGQLLWPLRASITGLRASPGPFEVLSILGKERALKRIKSAMGRLN